MATGRGRGYPNIPGQSGMQPQHQQLLGDRRELRRPMQVHATEDLTQGLSRMDPFGNNESFGSGAYGGSMMGPPHRPAPSSEGWSSGENQYEVMNQDSRNQHQSSYANQYAAQWNIGASEFVPQSSLSATAAEFVPRSMPRNTSQWGYQNQPQPQQSYYQAPVQGGQQPSYEDPQSYSGSRGIVNPYLAPVESSGSGMLYNIEEQLSDAISTVVFMPQKLDRTVATLAEKLNSSGVDISTLAGLATFLFDRCFSEVAFQPLAAKFCATLASKVTLVSENTTMLALFIERFQSLQRNHLSWLTSDPLSAKFIVEFTAQFFFYVDTFGLRKVDSLVDVLYDLFNTLFTVGSSDPENLKTAALMLKICGRALENSEKRSNGDPNADEKTIAERRTPKVDQLMSLVAKISRDDEKFSDVVRAEMKNLLEARESGSWGNASLLPDLSTASAAAKPRANAIVIEPDPNDTRTNNIVLNNNVRNSGNADMALTEEELAFMNEHMGGGSSSSPGDSERFSVNGDEEDDMGDDIRAAYEDFLQEQERQGRQKPS